MILDQLFKCKHPAKFLGIYEDCTTERCEDFNKITYHLFLGFVQKGLKYNM